MLESTNLSSWSLASGSPVVVGNEYQQSFAVSGAMKFYRARILDLDADSDGVSDWAETQLGSTLNAASSSRSSVSIDANLDGTPESTASGDYTTMVEQFQGASASAGWIRFRAGSIQKARSCGMPSRSP